VSLHLRVDYKYNYKEKNNINNNKYTWEVEFRGGKSRESISQKYGLMGPWVILMGPQILGPIARSSLGLNPSFERES
jgi:hypothetical protein